MMTLPDPSDKGTVDAAVSVIKWVSAVFAAAWVATKFLFKSGVQTGERLRMYKELEEDVRDLKAKIPLCMTKPEHEGLSRACISELEHKFDQRINSALADLREEMGTMNGNICKILGAMNITPIEQHQQRRRRTDKGEGKEV